MNPTQIYDIAGRLRQYPLMRSNAWRSPNGRGGRGALYVTVTMGILILLLVPGTLATPAAAPLAAGSPLDASSILYAAAATLGLTVGAHAKAPFFALVFTDSGLGPASAAGLGRVLQFHACDLVPPQRGRDRVRPHDRDELCRTALRNGHVRSRRRVDDQSDLVQGMVLLSYAALQLDRSPAGRAEQHHRGGSHGPLVPQRVQVPAHRVGDGQRAQRVDPLRAQRHPLVDRGPVDPYSDRVRDDGEELYGGGLGGFPDGPVHRHRVQLCLWGRAHLHHRGRRRFQAMGHGVPQLPVGQRLLEQDIPVLRGARVPHPQSLVHRELHADPDLGGVHELQPDADPGRGV